jgi:hypothetical protein
MEGGVMVYRKIGVRIWFDPEFRRLSIAEKLDVLEAIVFNRPSPEFADYAGPKWRQADSPKRRPDLYTAAWRALRLEVLKARGTVCEYCGRDCSDDPTVDHVRPVVAGVDPYDRANLMVSCRPCNSRKGGHEGWEAE